MHYNELVKYITSNDHYLDKNRIVTLTARTSVADEGELINFKLFDSTVSRGDQVKNERYPIRPLLQSTSIIGIVVGSYMPE